MVGIFKTDSVILMYNGLIYTDKNTNRNTAFFVNSELDENVDR